MPRLSLLAASLGLSAPAVDVEIDQVAIGSQFVSAGCLFVAAPGAKHHGLDYLSDALDAGAVAILTDREGDYPVPALIHPDPRSVAGEIARLVYDSGASELFAVTGTNGKTSTAYYLRQLLELSGTPTGLLSSAEQVMGGDSLVPELTTPEAPRVHQLLSEMRAAGQERCAIEVSAQALIRHRVDGLSFSVAGFTNLSRDHLDDFGSMEDYLAAKARLFEPQRCELAVIHVEDEYGRKLFEALEVPKVGLGEGLDYNYAFDGTSLRISGAHELTLGFAGSALMAKNLALAATMLLAKGVDIPAGLVVDHQVPGRLQLISERRPHVYVDYAHTPAGVLAAVSELSSSYPQLTVVLGASGNRDRGKRAEMARACKAASLLVITDQHPRDEDPAQIRGELVSAAQQGGINLVENPDPAAAIAAAIEATAEDGAILWCGPGNLKYREIAGTKVPFDAIDIARKAQK